ncbi:Outer membrane protein/outer membrane enzyme PagP, beta-barrel,Surface antigen msp4 [Cinara cedri]|uniref:Outer membrane protein/outer membrane enzyme PagP, beta-barrel,Surface antigen msp4 n=1 Tax=Cinara cedri TaxID=506608 RepID=A0A5E4NDB2_9HEMI|nr:Outer membrane protein/outer membrane enzyme PagP, beta-barrel,Surface antigen msp4 [Cinara cedri]
MNLVDYNPNYHSVLSANVAIGYQGESLGKGELELRSSQIKVDNVGLMEGPIFISFKLKGQQEQMKRTELNNDRIESKSIMANVYYQQDNGFFSFYPYVGVGLGVTQTKMFGEESVDSAYQLKVGLSHQFKGYNMTTHFKFLKAGDNGSFVNANKGDTIARIQYNDSTKHQYTLDLTEGKINQLKYAMLDDHGNVIGTEKTFILPKFLLNKLNDTFAWKTDLSNYTKTDGSNMTDDIQNKLMSHHTAQVFDFLSSLETEYNAMHL